MKNEAGAYYREVYDEHQTEEMQELLDFANMVFSMSYGGTDFSTLCQSIRTETLEGSDASYDERRQPYPRAGGQLSA